jgi:hypothetical protein
VKTQAHQENHEKEAELMPVTVQEFEDQLRQRMLNLDPAVFSVESAIVGIDVDSMAGIGIFGDFARVVVWFWLRCEERCGGLARKMPGSLTTIPLVSYAKDDNAFVLYSRASSKGATPMTWRKSSMTSFKTCKAAMRRTRSALASGFFPLI